MEGLDYNTLNNEQKEFVHHYKRIHDRLKVLQESMDSIQNETKELINELTELRKKETKIFNNG
jgi:septation ring formation regulator EzrA